MKRKFFPPSLVLLLLLDLLLLLFLRTHFGPLPEKSLNVHQDTPLSCILETQSQLKGALTIPTRLPPVVRMVAQGTIDIHQRKSKGKRVKESA